MNISLKNSERSSYQGNVSKLPQTQPTDNASTKDLPLIDIPTYSDINELTGNKDSSRFFLNVNNAFSKLDKAAKGIRKIETSEAKKFLSDIGVYGDSSNIVQNASINPVRLEPGGIIRLDSGRMVGLDFFNSKSRIMIGLNQLIKTNPKAAAEVWSAVSKNLGTPPTLYNSKNISGGTTPFPKNQVLLAEKPTTGFSRASDAMIRVTNTTTKQDFQS